LIELLFSGGVQLTISGTNFDLVKEPKMNVSMVFYNDGDIVRRYNITVITGSRACLMRY